MGSMAFLRREDTTGWRGFDSEALAPVLGPVLGPVRGSGGRC